MSDFFHGWRRKAGCVLLLMACAFVAAGMRSEVFYDCFRLPGWHHGFVVVSNRGRLLLIAADTEVEFGWESRDSERYIPFFNKHLNRRSHSIEWQYTTIGKVTVGIGKFRRAIGIKYHAAEIPYSCFYFPLTLFSANLLLWPGDRPAKKPPQS